MFGSLGLLLGAHRKIDKTVGLGVGALMLLYAWSARAIQLNFWCFTSVTVHHFFPRKFVYLICGTFWQLQMGYKRVAVVICSKSYYTNTVRWIDSDSYVLLPVMQRENVYINGARWSYVLTVSFKTDFIWLTYMRLRRDLNPTSWSFICSDRSVDYRQVPALAVMCGSHSRPSF